VTIANTAYWPESAENSYDLQIANNTVGGADLVRFEVRNNELWTSALGGNDTERAELDGSAGLVYAVGVPFWVAYDVMVEAGSPQIATAGGDPGGVAAWCVMGQIHGDNTENPVPWQLDYISDTFAVSIQTDPNQTWTTLWTDTAPTPRGTVRHVVVNISVSGKATDFCKVWIDGVQVVNFTGIIGSTNPDPHVYFKYGIYRGWQGDGYPPLANQIANVRQGTGSLASRITSPLPWPTHV